MFKEQSYSILKRKMNDLDKQLTQDQKRQIFQELKDRICNGRQFGYLIDEKALEIKQMCYCAPHLCYMLFGYGMPQLTWSKIPYCEKHARFVTNKVEEPDKVEPNKKWIYFYCSDCKDKIDYRETWQVVTDFIKEVISYQDPFKDEEDYGNLFWNFLKQQFAQFDIMMKELEANNPKDQLLKLKLGL